MRFLFTVLFGVLLAIFFSDVSTAGAITAVAVAVIVTVLHQVGSRSPARS